MRPDCRLAMYAGARHHRSDVYKWRCRFGGMEMSEARKLKVLEEENRTLKKLLAELILNASTLKEMLGKTTDAQLAETSCDLGDLGEELLAAAGL
jgi:hypothetical protein